jgi:hypothetical protein
MVVFVCLDTADICLSMVHCQQLARLPKLSGGQCVEKTNGFSRVATPERIPVMTFAPSVAIPNSFSIGKCLDSTTSSKA